MRLRFRTSIVAALLGLLLTSVSLVALTSYLNVRRSVELLSAQILGQAIGRIELRIRSQLDVARDQSKLNQLLIQRAAPGPDDEVALTRYLLDAVSVHEGLSDLSLSLEADGTMFDAARTPRGTLSMARLRPRPGGGLDLSNYAVHGDELTVVHQGPAKPENDSRPRPYYVAAKSAGHAVWTETYVFFGEGGVLDSPGVSYATPLFRPDRSLLGVLTADFTLRSICQFLRSLQILDHGTAFVVEYRADGSRRVIAHPNPDILTRAAASGSGRELVPVSELADASVVSLVSALPAALPSASASLTPVRFELGGEPYIGSYRALSDDGLRWVVCVVAPEEDILGPLRQGNRVTVAIVIASVSLAILLALWLGGSLARPLRGLADDAQAIGRFELDSRPTTPSRVVEVEQLTTAIEEMKRGLRSFRKYVPADLVRELLASGQEARVGGERKELTIHFSDIAGFTTIAETMAPEELVVLLGEYLEEMSAPIVLSGGTVDKYIGDAIMAFWGAPRADSDHALHACNAALQNRDRLDALNARWQAKGRPRLEARAALHTGEVIVGNVGGVVETTLTLPTGSRSSASTLASVGFS